jgi:MFS family permease
MGGLGFAILTVVLAKMTADWFVGRELTTAMGVLLASYPCGVALGLWMQPRLVEASGWRVAMHATAGLCLVAMLLVAMCWRLLRRPGALVPVRARRGALTRGEMFASVMSGVAWGGLNVAMLVFFSFAPRLFEATGMTTIGASGYVGAAMWVSALAVPLGGILAERIPAPLTTAIAICGCTAAALALLPTGVAPTLLLMFVGVGIGAPAAIIIALPGNVLRARARGLGFGIFYGVFFVEAAFGPLVAGWIEAWTSSIGLAIEFGALALVTSVVALAALAIPTSDRVPGVQRAMEITGQTGGDGARGP